MKKIILFIVGFFVITVLFAWLEFATLNAIFGSPHDETTIPDSLRTLEYNRKLSEESR